MYIKKLIILIFICLFGFVYSQRDDINLKIDSISQKKWDSIALDLDSLSNPSFSEVKVKFKDTIVVRPSGIVPQAPQEIPLTPFNFVKNYKKKWFYFGQNNLLFNQSSFSNWIAGGNDNIGVIGKINYNIIFKKNKHYLENIIQLGYGLVSSQGQGLRKTEDYINIQTNYGYELGKNYYFSSGLQFKSQFAVGYNYSETEDPSYSDRVSRFMAPGYLSIGTGISYNPSENFQAIFRPISGKFTFVLDPHLQQAGLYGLQNDGQNVRSELGAMLNLVYRLKIFKTASFDNQVNLFTNYLQHSERVDVSYSGALNLRFNKLISTIVTLDLVYDHDQIQKLQRKQTLSVGVSYNLGESLDKEKSKKIINLVN